MHVHRGEVARRHVPGLRPQRLGASVDGERVPRAEPAEQPPVRLAHRHHAGQPAERFGRASAEQAHLRGLRVQRLRRHELRGPQAIGRRIPRSTVFSRTRVLTSRPPPDSRIIRTADSTTSRTLANERQRGARAIASAAGLDHVGEARRGWRAIAGPRPASSPVTRVTSGGEAERSARRRSSRGIDQQPRRQQADERVHRRRGEAEPDRASDGREHQVFGQRVAGPGAVGRRPASSAPPVRACGSSSATGAGSRCSRSR